MTVSLWAWAGIPAIFVALIAGDLALARGGTSVRGAATLSGCGSRPGCGSSPSTSCFLLAGSMDRFSCFKQGLAVLLVFIGVKILISSIAHVPVSASLAMITGVGAGSVTASLWRDHTRIRPAGEQRRQVPR
jgi:hypothetical protein